MVNVPTGNANRQKALTAQTVAAEGQLQQILQIAELRGYKPWEQRAAAMNSS